MLVILIMKIFCLFELLGMCGKGRQTQKFLAHRVLPDVLNLQIVWQNKRIRTEKAYLFEIF